MKTEAMSQTMKNQGSIGKQTLMGMLVTWMMGKKATGTKHATQGQPIAVMKMRKVATETSTTTIAAAKAVTKYQT
jgi:hypothetical protein